MIPRMNIIAWGNVVPWVDLRQLEQDLVISRALVELFSHPGRGLGADLRNDRALRNLRW